MKDDTEVVEEQSSAEPSKSEKKLFYSAMSIGVLSMVGLILVICLVIYMMVEYNPSTGTSSFFRIIIGG